MAERPGYLNTRYSDGLDSVLTATAGENVTDVTIPMSRKA
jgi:hypothetical protein